MKLIKVLLIISLFSGSSHSQNTIEPMIGNLSKYLEKNHVLGEIISIAKSDTLFFSDGVSYADINKKDNVDTPLEQVRSITECKFPLVVNAKKEKIFKIENINFFLWALLLVTVLLDLVFNLKNNRNSRELYTLKDRKGIPEENAKILIASLNHIMHAKKPYLDEDLSLKQLSELVNTTERDLSKLLNRNLNTNFYDYINEYRITTFQKKIKTGIKNYTIMGLAYDSGFKSKSSFYRAFKKATGSSPTEFKRKIQ